MGLGQKNTAIELLNWLIATVYAGLGDRDKAFEWLEKAYQERSPGLTWLKVEPMLDSIRSDCRYATCCAGWACHKNINYMISQTISHYRIIEKLGGRVDLSRSL
jgi:hypothetical protein